MRKSILLLALFLCVTHFSNGQIPDIPVDLLTGSPNISIPIENVTEGSLTVPISLFYPGGGVKVEEMEGTAGMGWHLLGRGSVTRAVRGLPDDYTGTGEDTRRGWLFNNLAQSINNFTPSGDEDYTTCADEAGDYNFLFDLYSELHDTEPDIFSFNAPGLNGQFVLGTDGLPKLVPFQDIQIDVSMDALGIYAIQITNNLGVVYFFDVKERITRSSGTGTGTNYFSRVSRFYSTPADFTSVWYLSRISSPDGAEIIFRYESMNDEVLSKDHIAVVNEANASDTLYSIEDKFKARQLSAIETDAIIVNFEWQDGIIKSIYVNDRATSEKRSFTFVYVDTKDYRQSAWSGVKRAFLKEIYVSGNCDAYPSYSFTYDGVNFVDKTTVLPFWSREYQDIWGFYNANSSDLRPDIYVYDNLPDAERYRIVPIPGQTPSLHLNGSGRMVNPSAITAGSLTKITYPGGSSANITYEPNDHFDPQANETFSGGGIRVSKVILSGGERGSEDIVAEYEYTLEDGESSGRFLYRPVFAFGIGDQIIRSFHNLAPDRGILYSRTTVKQTGKGKTVYEFFNPGTYPSTTDLDWSATKNRIARYPKAQEPGQPVPPCVALGNQITGYYLLPFAPNMNFDFEQGLPSRIAHYAEGGTTPVEERIFSYQRIISGNADMKGLRYEKLDSNFVYAIYTIKAGISKEILTETTRTADDVDPTQFIESSATYSYSSIHKMLEAVSTTNSDGIIYKSSYRYAKDFSNLTDPDPAKPETVALKDLNDSGRHGEIIEVIESRNAGSGDMVVGASLTLHKTYADGKIHPHQKFVFPAVSGFGEAYVSGIPQTLIYDTDYIPTITYQTYNSAGMPLSVSDNRKDRSGTHYGFNNSLPVALIGNGYAEEAAYSDFESSTGFDFSLVSGSATTVPGWTGDKALSIVSGSILNKNNIQKGANRYRFSCWLSTSSEAQLYITVKEGTTIYSTATVSNSGGLNQWQYLETELDITNAGNLFTVELTTNSNVAIDDIRFYPASATLTTTAYKPLVGITSVTDDRGISSFKEYDGAGRLKYIKDRYKNIIEANEYRYKKELPSHVIASFTTDMSEEGIIQGNAVTFTATENACLSGLTYQWHVSDGSTSTMAGTAPQLTHTFSSTGYYTVHLRVESYDGSYDETFSSYCVKSGPAVETGTTAVFVLKPYETCTHAYTELYECLGWADNYIRTLRIKGSSCRDLQQREIQWFYRFSDMSGWVLIYPGDYDDGGETLVFNPYDFHAIGSFDIKTVVKGRCSDGQYPCYPSVDFSAETVTSFIYIEEQFCP